MKLHYPTKIVFWSLALLIAAALAVVVLEYPKIKQSRAQSPGLRSQVTGACSPNAAACQNNPKLCMDLNENVVCN